MIKDGVETVYCAWEDGKLNGSIGCLKEFILSILEDYTYLSKFF